MRRSVPWRTRPTGRRPLSEASAPERLHERGGSRAQSQDAAPRRGCGRTRRTHAALAGAPPDARWMRTSPKRPAVASGTSVAIWYAWHCPDRSSSCGGRSRWLGDLAVEGHRDHQREADRLGVGHRQRAGPRGWQVNAFGCAQASVQPKNIRVRPAARGSRCRSTARSCAARSSARPAPRSRGAPSSAWAASRMRSTKAFATIRIYGEILGELYLHGDRREPGQRGGHGLVVGEGTWPAGPRLPLAEPEGDGGRGGDNEVHPLNADRASMLCAPSGQCRNRRRRATTARRCRS